MKFLSLNNGLSMPIIGLGLSTFPEDPKTVEESVKIAIPIGYRHFDTATLYRTEFHLGNALNKELSSGKIKREDLFIVTKLPQIGMKPEFVEKYLVNSLKQLQLDYVDMYLIHWPMGMQFRSETDLFPLGPDGKNYLYDMETDICQVWKAMEEQVKAGRAKSIGLSNFNSEQIERIVKIAEILPSNNQVEIHAYFQQKELRETCKKHKIALTAYYPIGGQSRLNYPPAWQYTQAPPLLDDPVVNEIAKKHEKTPAQVLLRFLTQLDIAVIPKSSNPKRLAQNFNILDFHLDSEDMKSMEKLDRGEDARSCFGLPGGEHHPEYPFPSFQPEIV